MPTLKNISLPAKDSVARKKHILEKATLFFATYGYQNTDIQAIASTLSIGKGTIYRLFPSKEALFFATVDKAMGELEAFIKEKVAPITEDILRIKKALAAYFQFFNMHPECIELFVQERVEFRRRDISTYLAHRARRDTEWKELFVRLSLQGSVRQKNFDIIIDYITNLLYGSMFTDVFHKDSEPFAKSETALYEVPAPKSCLDIAKIQWPKHLDEGISRHNLVPPQIESVSSFSKSSSSQNKSEEWIDLLLYGILFTES